ncbi:unnamed protein product [Periconia digitata]|uniref:Thioesterase domain-containing protein n=1 Tax=Periconia digitata TaxID=1303443 RepID=A0A9W4U373_9PLEO|nr:unnamed protein product [Periconia digitata]
MYTIARLAGAGLGVRQAIVPFRSGIRLSVAPRFGGHSTTKTALETAGLRKLATDTNAISKSAQSIHSPTPLPGTAPPRPNRPLYIRLPIATALTIVAFTLGFSIMATPALPTADALLNPPTDEETLTLFTPTTAGLEAIESQIFSHPLTRSLLQDEKFIASRPHLKIPESMRHQNLTGGTLLGGDKISVPPLQFRTADGMEFVSFQYLGNALCGHPGIVHGGLLATLLDEGLARCCFAALPNKVAVTASLKIDYKKPVMAGQVVVLKAETTRVEGRKAWVTGRLETLPKEGEKEGVVLVEGEALFIEPKQAAAMKLVVV